MFVARYKEWKDNNVIEKLFRNEFLTWSYCNDKLDLMSRGYSSLHQKSPRPENIAICLRKQGREPDEEASTYF